MAHATPLNLGRVDPADFTVSTLDDEIRVDALCVRLLLAIRERLLREPHRTPLEVGQQCRGADLFLRDFVIAACGDNLFSLPPERVRQFAGHWYITSTLEPNAGELATILDGIAACYAVLAEHGLISPALHSAVAAACAELPWYRQRIDDYWAIETDGFRQWRAVCPLPERCR
jgi:hypothetical protein